MPTPPGFEIRQETPNIIEISVLDLMIIHRLSVLALFLFYVYCIAIWIIVSKMSKNIPK